MKYLFANWKTHLSVEESVALARAAREFELPADVELALFPSAAAFEAVRDAVGGAMPLGAQDGHPEGAIYALVGHSDRRAAGDTDEVVAKKLQSAADAGFAPVLCVGETKEERAAGKRDERIRAQVTSALKDARVQKVFIAYEPVWAIGSGQNDNPEDTASAVGVIKATLAEVASNAAALFLYGGSVNPQNVASYSEITDLAGVLVGRASTSASTLAALVTAF